MLRMAGHVYSVIKVRKKYILKVRKVYVYIKGKKDRQEVFVLKRICKVLSVCIVISWTIWTACVPAF